MPVCLRCNHTMDPCAALKRTQSSQNCGCKCHPWNQRSLRMCDNAELHLSIARDIAEKDGMRFEVKGDSINVYRSEKWAKKYPELPALLFSCDAATPWHAEGWICGYLAHRDETLMYPGYDAKRRMEEERKEYPPRAGTMTLDELLTTECALEVTPEDRIEFADCGESTILGFKLVRLLDDVTLLHLSIAEYEDELFQRVRKMVGENTNPSWLRARVADTLMDRNVIDEDKHYELTR